MPPIPPMWPAMPPASGESEERRRVTPSGATPPSRSPPRSRRRAHSDPHDLPGAGARPGGLRRLRPRGQRHRARHPARRLRHLAVDGAASSPSPAGGDERDRARAGGRPEAEADRGRAICVVLFALAEPISNAYDVRSGLAAARRWRWRCSDRASSASIGRRRGDRPGVADPADDAAESAVEAGASIALVLLGAGVAGAAFGRAIGYVFGAVFASC